MSTTLNGSSMLECFERSNAREIRNGIMFDFYPGLSHMYKLAYTINTKQYLYTDMQTK